MGEGRWRGRGKRDWICDRLRRLGYGRGRKMSGAITAPCVRAASTHLAKKSPRFRFDPAQLSVRIWSALNRTYKQWASIFNNDAVLTSALLERLLHP